MDDIGGTSFGEGEKAGIDDGYQTGQERGYPERDCLEEVVFEFFIADPVEYLLPLRTNRSDECHSNED